MQGSPRSGSSGAAVREQTNREQDELPKASKWPSEGNGQFQNLRLEHGPRQPEEEKSSRLMDELVGSPLFRRFACDLNEVSHGLLLDDDRLE